MLNIWEKETKCFWLSRFVVFVVCLLVLFSRPVVYGIVQLMTHEIYVGKVIGCESKLVRYGLHGSYSVYTPFVEVEMNGSQVVLPAELELIPCKEKGTLVKVLVDEYHTEARIISITGFWIQGLEIVGYFLAIVLIYSVVYSILSQHEYVVIDYSKGLTARKVKAKRL